MTYQNIIVETQGRVGIIRLNRPQALNALNKALVDELTRAIGAFDADDKVGCLLLTGNEKAKGACFRLVQGEICQDWRRAGRRYA